MIQEKHWCEPNLRHHRDTILLIGCALKIVDNLENSLNAYVEENKHIKDVGIRVGTVRRMITIAKKKAGI